jgi:hypothetical protein
MAEQKILYKIGSKGNEVTNIQNALGDYYTSLGGVPDADYGSKTHDAVENWQKAWNDDPAHANDQITKDGIVGPQTYPRLMQWSKDRTAAAATPAAPAVTSTTTVPPVAAPVSVTTQPAVTNGIIDDQTAKMNEVLDPATGKAKEDLAPKYLVDWSNVDNVYQEAKRLNLPLAQVLQDYQRWGNDTGNPTYWINAMFQDADLTKSVGDNEEEKKKAERRERWNSVNNFLLHLGNVIGNVGGKGYASMKLEDPIQWTERQRRLKEKAEEQRRLNNQSLLAQMNRDKENQRAYELKKQQQEANNLYRQSMADYRKAQAEAAARKQDNNDKVADSRVRLNDAKTDQTQKLTPVKIETEKSKAARYRRPSGSGGRGKVNSTVTTVNELNPDGKVTRSTRTTEYNKPTGKGKGKVSTGIQWKSSKKK